MTALHPRGLIAFAICVFLLHAGLLAFLFGPYCVDDAYISFRYAASLLNGDGLVFNPGERVEGYTNFAWLLVLAVVQAAGLDPAWAARLLNGLLGAGLVGLALRFLAPRAGRPAALWLAALLLACDGAIARWGQDGLETILFALLLFASTAQLSRALERLASAHGERMRFCGWGFLAALATLARPEGALVFATGFVFALVHVLRGDAASRGRCLRLVGMGVGSYLLLVVPWTLWRWGYYGALVPNTFHAKVGATLAQVERGGRYLWRYFGSSHASVTALIAAVAAAQVAVRARISLWEAHFLIVSVVFVGYVAAVGGDWMAGSRFIVPVAPLIALVLANRLADALARLRAPVQRPAAVVAFALALTLAGTTTLGTALSPGLSEQRSREAARRQLAAYLRENASADDAVLTPEIGLIAWETGLEVRDLHGLTDPHIAQLHVENMGRGRAGHEKFDYDYSFASRPDWVWFPGVENFYSRRLETFEPLRDYRIASVMAAGSAPIHRSFRYVLKRKKPAARDAR